MNQMHPPSPPSSTNPLSPQIISKRSASDTSFKTSTTSSSAPGTPVDSTSSCSASLSASSTPLVVEESDREDRELAEEEVAAPTVPEVDDFAEGSFEEDILEEEEGRQQSLSSVNNNMTAAAGGRARPLAVDTSAPPATPVGGPSPGTTNPLSPEVTPRFSAFLDFINQPTGDEGDKSSSAQPQQQRGEENNGGNEEEEFYTPKSPNAISQEANNGQGAISPRLGVPNVDHVDASPEYGRSPTKEDGRDSTEGSTHVSNADPKKLEGAANVVVGSPTSNSSFAITSNMAPKVDSPSSTVGGKTLRRSSTRRSSSSGSGSRKPLPQTSSSIETTQPSSQTSAAVTQSSLPSQPSNPQSSSQSTQPSNTNSSKKYQSYTNRYPATMADFVSASNTKTKVGKRCYRLNLERPFDIHCEQSPLEYGDYMAPWSKQVYPQTVGPTEYCPPRHLGGDELVWRELMRWSEDSSEEKVNSLDVLDTAQNVVEGEDELMDSKGSKSLMSGVLSPMGSVHLNEEEKRGSADELENGSAKRTVEHGAIAAHVGTSPTGGWRTLHATEINTVRKLGERNNHGELTFQTYDLSHLALNTAGTNKPTAAADMVMRNGGVSTTPSGQSGVMVEGVGVIPLRSVFSMDSTTSEDEKLNPKTPEEMADDTARLFRRSELSLKEKAEREEKEEAERQEQARKEEIERQEREKREMQERFQRERETGLLDEDSPLDRSSRGRGHRRKFSSGGKKLFKQLSRAFSVEATNSNLEASWRGSSSHRRTNSRQGTSGSGRPSMVKRSSMQALTIDKARDLVDESDDEGSVVGQEEQEGEDKKPLNVSLYILGEYDILNDLVNDGAKRLRENKTNSDLPLLLQNEPCPPPDRWVRTTGWAKCNPSSNYAKDPPAEFDWVRYEDKLRLRKDEYKERQVWTTQSGEMKYSLLKGSTDTQTTDATADNSDDHSEDEHHRIGGRLTRVTRAGSSSSSKAPEPPADVTPKTRNRSDSNASAGAAGGARGHFNQKNSDKLSASARPARSSSRFTSSKSSSSAVDSLSASARTSSSKSHRRSASHAVDNMSASSRTPRNRTTSFGGSSGGGAKSHFNKTHTRAASEAAAVDSLSVSARTPRTRTHFRSATSDNLSASARTPRGGVGTRFSRMMGRKKSTGNSMAE